MLRLVVNPGAVSDSIVEKISLDESILLVPAAPRGELELAVE